jgi:glycosyltransferase involved in cell wall biosynthesis
MNSPSVTVLTCVYNGLPYLKEAIDSTLNQSFTDFEYLIIDDCSPDINVVKLIESYDDPRIRFIKNKKNLGVSNTINKALSLIKTKYVVRIDQDDVNLSTRIADQIDFLEKNPELSIVCSWEHAINDKGEKLFDWKNKVDNYGTFLGFVLIGLCPIWHPSIAFKTNAIIEAGGFDIEYTRAEDFEMTTRLALKRYGARVIPKFHLLQRQHESSQSREFDDKQAEVTRRIHNESLKYFSKHPEIEELAKFIRLERSSNNQLNQDYLLRLSLVLNDLFVNIKNKQKMSDLEIKSLKKIVYRRAGYGIQYASYLSRMPSVFFFPIFYLLSPLQLTKFRHILTSTYQNFLKLRYFLK